MKALLWTILIFLWWVGSVLGQSYRENLPISQVQIFQRMLLQAEDRNFDSAQKSALFLDPLFSAFQTKFGVNLRSSLQDKIAQKDKAGLESVIFNAAFLDLLDLFQIGGEEAEGRNLERSRVRVKVAYQDYLILSPSISDKAFSADQKIKNDFRMLTLGTESILNPAEYKRLTSEIEQMILSAYPAYKIK